MKKNLITLIILVLCLANVALTAVMAFMIIPQSQQANTLITKVVEAIDLEMESGADIDTSQAVNIADLKTYAIEDQQTISLKKGDDGEQHMFVTNISISMDSTNEGYTELGISEGNLDAYQQQILGKLTDVISSFTVTEIQNDMDEVKAQCIAALQQLFGSTFITDVIFTGTIIQ